MEREEINLSNIESLQLEPAPRYRGLGDVVATITHLTGIDKLAALISRWRGKDCGCNRRQELLNQIVPFSKD